MKQKAHPYYCSLITVHLLLFTFFFLLISAQTVTIKGKADPSYLSQADSIYTYIYEDYISYTEKELAKCKLDSIGNFSLTFSLPYTSYLFLTIDNAKAEIVCEPGKTYDVKFLPKDSNTVNSLSRTIPVALEFRNSNNSELNFLLADFDGRLESFLQDHQGMIIKKEKAIAGKIDTLKRLFQEKYSTYNNVYLNNHIAYAFASLEYNLILKGKPTLFENYIRSKPVQENNYDYMTFFHQFFAPVSDILISSGKAQLEINSKQVFSSLVSYYKQNKLLQNDTLCQAVVLKSLSEHSKFPGAYKINALLTVLEQAKTQCISPAGKIAADNLKEKLGIMAVGSFPPQINFENEKGELVSLDEYKGRYVYLNFWTSWSAISTQELTLIPELKKLYGSKITFVSICVDKKKESMTDYLSKFPKYDWNFLYCNNYKQVKEKFDVLVVPAYFLLDKNGKVFLSPAPNPAEADPTFMKIKKRQF